MGTRGHGASISGLGCGSDEGGGRGVGRVGAHEGGRAPRGGGAGASECFKALQKLRGELVLGLKADDAAKLRAACFGWPWVR